MSDRTTRPTRGPPHTAPVRWESTGGVWTVLVLERRGLLRGEVHKHGGLRWADWLNTALTELGAPPLEQMVER